MSWMDLNELFPDRDYGFSMKMRPCAPMDFFQATPDGASLLAERGHWLSVDPDHHVASDDWRWNLDGLLEFARSTGVAMADEASAGPQEGLAHLTRLGRHWEPDFLVVTPDDDDVFRLCGGCVCFPSGWDLPSKLGRTVGAIHGVVPGLNDEIGRRIDAFLHRIKPGVGWLRANWGLSAASELNQHPNRNIPAMDQQTDPATVSVRIEHQLLTRWGDSSAVLFGIRLENVSLAVVRANRTLATGLRRALQTMPEPMLNYKRLWNVRPRLLDYLS